MEKSSSRVEGAERGRDADTSLLHELDAKNLSERIILRGVETHEVLGVVLLLREVLARSLFETYQHDASLLNRVLDNYEPARGQPDRGHRRRRPQHDAGRW